MAHTLSKAEDGYLQGESDWRDGEGHRHRREFFFFLGLYKGVRGFQSEHGLLCEASVALGLQM